MDPILANWAAGSLAIIGTVLLQFGAQMLLLRIGSLRGGRMLDIGLHNPRLVLPILMVVFLLIVGHLLQVMIWAIAYTTLGELDGFSDAAYFSLASYTTVGANELELSKAHRVLGALEAGIGVLMFGWSTAILVAMLARVDRRSAGR